MVAALLLIDFIILLTWQFVDPLTSKAEYMTLKVNTLTPPGAHHQVLSLPKRAHVD